MNKNGFIIHKATSFSKSLRIKLSYHMCFLHLGVKGGDYLKIFSSKTNICCIFIVSMSAKLSYMLGVEKKQKLMM